MKKIILIILSLALLGGIITFIFTRFAYQKEEARRLDAIDSFIACEAAGYPVMESYPRRCRAGEETFTEEISPTPTTTTRYFGNEAAGDLNGDGQADRAFIVTQDGGGSGTFYYVAASLTKAETPENLNTIFLGDRIAPQTTEIREGKIVVNYADRKEDEPMSAAPSVGVSRYFEVRNNELVETGVGTTSINTVGSQTIRQAGETCGENIGVCGAGFKCAYPCGIQGCENVCLPEDELGRPGARQD